MFGVGGGEGENALTLGGSDPVKPANSVLVSFGGVASSPGRVLGGGIFLTVVVQTPVDKGV